MPETPAPAVVVMAIEEVDTPALLVDLDAFERNLQRMADAISGSDARLRPHSKTHKCPGVAMRQIDHGAVGVEEAEHFGAESGGGAVGDVRLRALVLVERRVGRRLRRRAERRTSGRRKTGGEGRSRRTGARPS